VPKYKVLTTYVSAAGHTYPTGSIVEIDAPIAPLTDYPDAHQHPHVLQPNLELVADDVRVTMPSETQPGHRVHSNLDQKHG
jgi:hypothetical protein